VRQPAWPTQFHSVRPPLPPTLTEEDRSPALGGGRHPRLRPEKDAGCCCWPACARRRTAALGGGLQLPPARSPALRGGLLTLGRRWPVLSRCRLRSSSLPLSRHRCSVVKLSPPPLPHLPPGRLAPATDRKKAFHRRILILP
jgi:hypothetical protein